MLRQIQFHTTSRNIRLSYLKDLAIVALVFAIVIFCRGAPPVIKVLLPFFLTGLSVAATSGSKVSELEFDLSSKKLFVKYAGISKREIIKCIPFDDLSYTYTYRYHYFFWKFTTLRVRSRGKIEFSLVAERNGWSTNKLNEVSGYLQEICDTE